MAIAQTLRPPETEDIPDEPVEPVEELSTASSDETALPADAAAALDEGVEVDAETAAASDAVEDVGGPLAKPDLAPIWLPEHERVASSHVAVRPPDVVEGYGWQSRLMTALFETQSKLIASLGTIVALGAFFAVVPTLIDAVWAGVASHAVYQSWTLAIMLLITARVRSVSLGIVARHWLAGMFASVVLVYFVAKPVEALGIVPVLEDLFTVVLLVGAIVIGRRRWRHPNLSDLMILGFAVGGGYSLHSAALAGQSAGRGFGLDAGLLVPAIRQTEGMVHVGQPVWTSMLALAVGLVLLHRHQAAAAVGALVIAAFAIGDHLAVADTNSVYDLFRQASFNSRLVLVMAVAGFAAAVVLDRRRCAQIAERDHLFPTDREQMPQLGEVTPEPEIEFHRMLMGSRFRRQRNGVYTTIDATPVHWPPLAADSELAAAPVAEMARLARAAHIPAGPGTSSSGWVADSDKPGSHRFVGSSGSTTYVCTADSASVSTPRARPDAASLLKRQTPSDFRQIVAAGIAGVSVLIAVRVLTAADPSSLIADVGIADPGPALIATGLGAVASLVALVGAEPQATEDAWALGPSDDPRPDRPDECEA